MNTQSNGYTVVYSAIMVVIVAAALTLVSQGLKSRQIANEENANRASILKSAGIQAGEDVSADFKKYVTDGTEAKGQKCPVCGHETLVYQEGCLICKNCGASRCG